MYLGSDPGFQAVIKAKPSHFLVDEITNFQKDFAAEDRNKTGDASSNINLKRNNPRPLKSASKHAKLETLPEASNIILSHNEYIGIDKSSDTLITFKCEPAWCESYLRAQLSNSNYSAVASLAQAATKETGMLNYDHKSIPLGTFHAKHNRFLLHRCISYLFPQLKTVTTPQCAIVTVIQSPVYKLFSDILDHDKTKELLRFIMVERLEKSKEMVEIKGNFTKEVRGKIHHLIGKHYGKVVETKTCCGAGDRSYSIKVRSKGEKCRGAKYDSNIITAFTLWKKNTETNAAIHQLSTHLRLRPHMFSFAGNKDKRAVTTQTCTVSGISPTIFEADCETLPDNLRVYNALQVTRAVHLGELECNRFTIRITKVQKHPSDEMSDVKQLVVSSLESVKKHGFVNYFGPQRFGRRVPTNSQVRKGEYNFVPVLEAPLIGFAMLVGDFKRAVNVLLFPSDGGLTSVTSEESEEAKSYFQSTGDVEGTLQRMPHHRTREISILRTLRRYGTTETYAYVKALMGLTHSARLLYVHSFCSWVWNEIATIRLRKYGIKVVPGDLVLETGEDCDSDVDKVSSTSDGKVYVITEDDIANDRVHLEDIVLTVPGNRVTFPPNMENEYRKFLGFYETGDGTTVSPSNSRNFRIPDLKLNAPGTYRKLLEFPKNLSFKFLGFHESQSKNEVGANVISEAFTHNRGGQTEGDDHSTIPTKPCVISSVSSPDGDVKVLCHRSDADAIRHVTQTPALTSADQSTNKEFKRARNLPVCDVELKFDLPPSCYATTFLQEVTKGNLVQ